MKKKISIEGMSCEHCVKHVTEALNEISEVTSVKVDLKEKNAIVEFSQEIEEEKIKSILDEVGYEVVGIEEI